MHFFCFGWYSSQAISSIAVAGCSAFGGGGTAPNFYNFHPFSTNLISERRGKMEMVRKWSECRISRSKRKWAVLGPCDGKCSSQGEVTNWATILTDFHLLVPIFLSLEDMLTTHMLLEGCYQSIILTHFWCHNEGKKILGTVCSSMLSDCIWI